MAYRRGDRIIGFTPGFIPFTVLYGIVITAVRVVDWLLYRIRIEGRENLRGLRRAILVSNHTLLLDPGLIGHAIRPRRTYFTMLEETALIPYLGTFVRLLGGVPIPEGPGSLLALEDAARAALSRAGAPAFLSRGGVLQGLPGHPSLPPRGVPARLPDGPARGPCHDGAARDQALRADPARGIRADHPVPAPGHHGDREPGRPAAAHGGQPRPETGCPAHEPAGPAGHAAGDRQQGRLALPVPGTMPRLVRQPLEGTAPRPAPADTQSAQAI